MKKIEAFIKVTIEEEKNDCGLYGEYLEKIIPQIKKDGIHLEDYAVFHHTSNCEEEMYFNYLMNHILKNTYDTNITFMSFEEWKKEQKNNSLDIIEIAASGGSYNMNGIPLIFTLFQYETQKDDKYWLKIEMETTVDEEFYGEEYLKTKKILKQYNKHPYGSYDPEQLNKIMSHYTDDYADFEYNEENEEWHGNIY
jgi:hypothetical protein